ncbi:signal recognition particle-docking protein FtsY [Alishewanella sp. 16-MA]|uniref:Signal recognition particle receptor FtsY n=1 Tax=Alishewanella maricola TaxID=2795740 RepID=A0ABS8BZ28_9ALTE|nr:signal recognition particle-docking protein FtsY [Alishewanella maricola]MCB5225324.1 signal recognition particle-docking protein FtsY [Alishewanella maricola]
MTKQNKLFSWLGFGKKNNPPADAPAADTNKNDATPAAVEPAAEPLVTLTQPNADKSPETAAAEPAVTDATPASDVQVLSEPTAVTAALKPAESVAEPTPVEAAPVKSAEVEQAATKPHAEVETSSQHAAVSPDVAVSGENNAEPIAAAQTQKKPGFFTRLKQGLAKTSQNLGAGLAGLFVGKKIDEELYEELETQLLLADVGMDTTQKLIKQLTTHADRKALKDAGLLFDKLQLDMATLLHDVEQPLIPENSSGPFVILMVGVNGVGKTTTIGKMAQQFKQQGKSVMLAAGDTFRAAAVEQLQVWGERNKIPVIAQHTGADSASVIFDAYQAAKARKVDILIADTAGRLQNKAHLMEELKKIVRVLQKIDVQAPHEVMLTLDAGTGQNALSQAKLFNEAVPLTGISLTKLDGTAKGGVIFAIADQFKVPIRFIGVGEAIDDLRQFAAKDFIRALFNKD